MDVRPKPGQSVDDFMEELDREIDEDAMKREEVSVVVEPSSGELSVVEEEEAEAPRPGRPLLLQPAPGQCVDDFMEELDGQMNEEDMSREEWDALYAELLSEERAVHEEEREVDEAVQRANRIAQLSPAPEPRKDVECTKMGTPCSPKWDDDWIEAVDKTEEEVGHRCCGARVNGVYPCELEASHENGRCRFHGGGLGSGAQKGNTNARIHGLYSRRLQQCGGHCPHWNTCPFAGEDVKSLPEAKRPLCTFEEQEMDMLRKMEIGRAHV